MRKSNRNGSASGNGSALVTVPLAKKAVDPMCKIRIDQPNDKQVTGSAPLSELLSKLTARFYLTDFQRSRLSQEGRLHLKYARPDDYTTLTVVQA